MITDTIANAQRYAALHPDFAEALTLLQTIDFSKLNDGAVPCLNPNIRIFIGSEAMRTQTEAKLEAHLQHIDIQVPLSQSEGYGWAARNNLKQGLGYQAQRDIEFFEDAPIRWLEVAVGEFALFFPNDAHAPLVGNQTSIRKAVFKIRSADYRITP